MVTSKCSDLSEKIQQLRDHGAVMSDLQRHLGAKPYLLADHIHAGFNQRMTDIQGALGDKQMDRANTIIKERNRIALEFISAFKSLKSLRMPVIPADYDHGFQSFACLFKPESLNDEQQIQQVHKTRNKWMEKLQKFGISTRPSTHAVHMLAYYAKKYKLVRSDFPNAWIANDCSISLPLFHGMTEHEIHYVKKTVIETIAEV